MNPNRIGIDKMLDLMNSKSLQHQLNLRGLNMIDLSNKYKRV